VTTADEQLVAELAEALHGMYGDAFADPDYSREAAKLLPVVLADRRRAVAAALREAADSLERRRSGLRGVLDVMSHADLDRSTYSRWLRARADAVETGDGQ
jgi:RNase H-fold protein (predicted Holliday junction resolvase)